MSGTEIRRVLLASLTGLNAVESSEEVKTVTKKKGNVTCVDRNGEPIPNYRWAMAEKRANSRGVLKLVGLYDEQFFGEDEADDFREVVKNALGSTRKAKDNKSGNVVKSTQLEIE